MQATMSQIFELGIISFTYNQVTAIFVDIIRIIENVAFYEHIS